MLGLVYVSVKYLDGTIGLGLYCLWLNMDSRFHGGGGSCSA